MDNREIAKEILLCLIERYGRVITDTDVLVSAAIEATGQIAAAFPDEPPRACGYNELPDPRVMIDDYDDDDE